jgi:GT2 family glycosyltransferase
VSGAGPRVVIVAYHGEHSLERCLSALERAVPVIIVDNSSSPQLASAARRHGAAYLDAGFNRGFAAGVNLALSYHAGDTADVVLVNPDAVVTPQAIGRMTELLRQPRNARVAAVTLRLVDPGGVEQRSAWPFPSPFRMVAEAVGLGRWRTGKEFVVGAVLLLRREAIEDVGLFDERFFLYAEEADWQRRAHARGWRSVVCPDVVAQHIGGGTSYDERRREALFHAAQETYIRKWYGASGWWVYRLAAVLGAGARAVVLTDNRRQKALRRMLLYLRGPRRSAALGSR